MEASKQRKFDIEEYKGKVVGALEKLQATQKPGEVAGKGGKADVIRAAAKEIKALLAKGYTAQQIAGAIQQDVFGILPKTITEIIAQNAPKSPRVKIKKQATEQRTTAQSKSATFPILEDKDDL